MRARKPRQLDSDDDWEPSQDEGSKKRKRIISDDAEGEESRPHKQTRPSRRKSNKGGDTLPQPTPQEGGSTRRGAEGSSTRRGTDESSTRRGTEGGSTQLNDIIPLPPSPPSINNYLRRLEVDKTCPAGILDKKGTEFDGLFLPRGLKVTAAWKTKMERVARETQEAYAERERDGTWFFPEYHAFKERRENYWRDIHPGKQDLPPGWPGVGLIHGLADEHLVPNYWMQVYEGDDRAPSGIRIDKLGVPYDRLTRGDYLSKSPTRRSNNTNVQNEKPSIGKKSTNNLVPESPGSAVVDTQEVLPPLLKSNNTPTENSSSQIFDILPISLAVDSPEAVPAPVACDNEGTDCLRPPVPQPDERFSSASSRGVHSTTTTDIMTTRMTTPEVDSMPAMDNIDSPALSDIDVDLPPYPDNKDDDASWLDLIDFTEPSKDAPAIEDHALHKKIPTVRVSSYSNAVPPPVPQPKEQFSSASSPGVYSMTTTDITTTRMTTPEVDSIPATDNIDSPARSDIDVDLSPYPVNKDYDASQSSCLIDFTRASKDALAIEDHALHTKIPTVRVSSYSSAVLSHQDQVAQKFIDHMYKSSALMFQKPPVALAPQSMSTFVSDNLNDQDYMPISSPHASPSLPPSPSRSLAFKDPSGEDYMPISSLHTSPCPSPLPSGSPISKDLSGEDHISRSSPNASPPPSPLSGSQASERSFLIPKRTPRPGVDKKKNTSQSPVDFILYSPQKARRAPKLKVPKPYTPEFLLDNMNALGIRAMDPSKKKKIREFFGLVGGIHELIQSRDKSVETTPECIPGYDNLLKDWVPKFAVGEIPSKMAALDLTDRELRHRVKKVVGIIAYISRKWPWEIVWKEKNDEIRLKAAFFIARCRQWAEVLGSKRHISHNSAS